jgi:hypothetical protein
MNTFQGFEFGKALMAGQEAFSKELTEIGKAAYELVDANGVVDVIKIKKCLNKVHKAIDTAITVSLLKSGCKFDVNNVSDSSQWIENRLSE